MTRHQLTKKLARQLLELEIIGENDMGHLPRRLAGRYHTITRNMRMLVNDLRDGDADERRDFIAELADTCGNCGVGAGEHADDCPRL